VAYRGKLLKMFTNISARRLRRRYPVVPASGCGIDGLGERIRYASEFLNQNPGLETLRIILRAWHASCFIGGQNDLETGWPARFNTGAFVWAGQSSTPGELRSFKASSPRLHPTRPQSPGFSSSQESIFEDAFSQLAVLAQSGWGSREISPSPRTEINPRTSSVRRRLRIQTSLRRLRHCAPVPIGVAIVSVDPLLRFWLRPCRPNPPRWHDARVRR